MWRGFSSLQDAGARAAFIHTLRTILDPGGQRVNATDRLYLAAEMPSLIMWGERDPIIPFRHGLLASETIPNSRFVSFPDAGHFPYRDDPRRFVRELTDFIESTEPGDTRDERLRELLREGA
jgi:pimeloyl-ACP methyl ester carboxylesterase